MAKRRAGLPEGFTLDIERPADKPIRMGDYLDEIDARPAGAGVVVARESGTATQESVSEPISPARKPHSSTKKAEKHAAQAKIASEPPGTTKAPKAARAAPASAEVPRTRLNVSVDGQRKLDAIWQRMREFGPEKTLRKSEIIEAMILATYEARDQLDLSNVRRRGKYGSTTHKNFPIALAESVKRAISEITGSD